MHAHCRDALDMRTHCHPHNHPGVKRAREDMRLLQQRQAEQTPHERRTLATKSRLRAKLQRREKQEQSSGAPAQDDGNLERLVAPVHGAAQPEQSPSKANIVNSKHKSKSGGKTKKKKKKKR